MNKRSFIISCCGAAAFAALMGNGAVRALAGQLSGSDQERILRLTRNAGIRVNLLSVKDVQNIVRLKKDRHLLISLQSREEYLAGHVPGAFSFLPENLSDPERLSALIAKLPKNKTIVLICSNGHLSSAVMLFLLQLGFDAAAMAFGMDGWNRAFAGSGAYKGDIGGDIELALRRLPMDSPAAAPEYSGLGDNDLVVAKTGGKFVNKLEPAWAREKHPDTMLFCLRRPEDYAAGHIPGAINLPSEAFYGGDRIILRIPRDKKLVLSCYVGHYSSGAALLLTQLGYEVYSLAWGMAGWNNKHIGPIIQTLEQDPALPVEKGPGHSFMES